jgi:hypothetical protein
VSVWVSNPITRIEKKGQRNPNTNVLVGPAFMFELGNYGTKLLFRIKIKINIFPTDIQWWRWNRNFGKFTIKSKSKFM